MAKRGRPKKSKAVKAVEPVVKKKRGRPPKNKEVIDIEPVIEDTPEVQETPDESEINPTTVHSFCPDCGTELKNISIKDDFDDENLETFGCPECMMEVIKDNEITLIIDKHGMKLDFNMLEIAKTEE